MTDQPAASAAPTPDLDDARGHVSSLLGEADGDRYSTPFLAAARIETLIDAVEATAAERDRLKALNERLVKELQDAVKHCTNCDGTGTAYMGDETEWGQSPGSSAHPCCLCKDWRTALDEASKR